MLTVLLALGLMNTETTAQLPLPVRPTSIPTSPATFAMELTVRLDAVATHEFRSIEVSNYNYWRANHRQWTSDRYAQPKVPQIAQNEPIRSVAYSLNGLRKWGYSSYLPWHAVFQERAGLLMPGLCVKPGEVIGYRIIQKPDEHSLEYVAIIDGTAYCLVRANSGEELERKIVARFNSYIEEITSPKQSPPENNPSVLTRAWVWSQSH